jgi:site-specific recombinase XerD
MQPLLKFQPFLLLLAAGPCICYTTPNLRKLPVFMYLSKRPINTLAIRKSHETEADFVPHLRIEEVQELARQAEATARVGKGERDSRLIQTLFDGCFRVSEVLKLSPESLVQKRFPPPLAP